MNNYELLDHTADIGIRVKGGDLKEIFEHAASAMFDIIAGEHKVEAKEKKELKIQQKGDNLEELFINWLNELLSLSATEELIFSDFKINKLDDINLEATATGASMQDYQVKTEIKAATYHALKLEQVKSGWQAEVIFDV